MSSQKDILSSTDRRAQRQSKQIETSPARRSKRIETVPAVSSSLASSSPALSGATGTVQLAGAAAHAIEGSVASAPGLKPHEWISERISRRSSTGKHSNVGKHSKTNNSEQSRSKAQSQVRSQATIQSALQGVLRGKPKAGSKNGEQGGSNDGLQGRSQGTPQDTLQPTPKARPTVDQLKAELAYERKRRRKGRVFRTTIYALVVVAAVAVLISMLAMPVFRVYGSSMSPTLSEGDIAVSIKGVNMDTGDLVVFYYENKVLIKRYIAGPGQWVNIDEDGNVYVDGVLLDEPYLSEKALGECDIDLPYQVPEGRIFVLGDHRSTSVDSRSTSLGCISEEMIVGKIVFRIWPLSGFGAM